MEASNIFVAVMSLIGTLGGAYLGINKAIAVIEERIKGLSERVDKHNQVVERTYKLESDVRTVFIRIEEINDKLKD